MRFNGTDYAWLEELKVGDKVIIFKRGISEPIALTVDRITKTQIIASDGNRYRKHDGNQIGSGMYYGRTLEKATPERLDKAERAKLATNLANAKWEKLPLEKLRQIKLLLDEAAAELAHEKELRESST